MQATGEKNSNLLTSSCWGQFLRSDTETDFPRTVRSAKRSRFAATVFVRSKPVNWVRILPQMFMFLTDTTKTDVLHILVRTHLLVLTCQHSCFLLVIIDQYVENAAARSWSWFKSGDRGGVVIGQKYTDTFFWGATSGKFLIQNLIFPVCGNDEARPGGGIMNMRRKNFSRKPYRLHQFCSRWQNAFWHRSVHNSYTDTLTSQVTASFNLGRKMF